MTDEKYRCNLCRYQFISPTKALAKAAMQRHYQLRHPAHKAPTKPFD